ncbi:acyl-CoA thioester hydrolase [Parapedobacter composti]|uniref:Acyl-CoA thioester hydrolase n=1 Tax=Parapedobacter composti TaxID=623281 RepID=A0A1I1GH91_9SPHI|nr:acyl-CoA thioesterase [Parapedobacter composti]SFC09218.1 acyl-CoA thioester hydrolase [Parapedobacter composti]
MQIKNVFYEGQVIWAQIDANRHLRHSAYADFCAQARSNMLDKIGLSLGRIAEAGIGPVLFREELVYLREIHLNDAVAVTVELTRYNAANSRFSFRHEIYRSDGTKCAVVTVDGAWLDLRKRKLTVLPADWQAIVEQLPRSEDYQEVST